MRIVLVFMLLSKFAYAQDSDKGLNQLSWLEGTWNRTNIKAGKSAHERWVRTGKGELMGWGVSMTMTGSDTTFVEKLKIIYKDNAFYYVADVPENKDLTYFKFTELTTTGFVCEDPAHDFPKKISYQVEGNKLKAIISGNGKSIEYLFEKEN
ncbi:MAG: hypothetical protein IPK96_15180 [Flammeovirgaceae bacterium]|jgi:hypothetical protein|nr:hypothetical protein [Flammeovirgaceae bacterium]